jgi:hypothetical protein
MKQLEAMTETMGPQGVSILPTLTKIMNLKKKDFQSNLPRRHTRRTTGLDQVTQSVLKAAQPINGDSPRSSVKRGVVRKSPEPPIVLFKHRLEKPVVENQEEKERREQQEYLF